MSPNTKVSNKTFAKELSNPCTIHDESRLESVDSQNLDLRTTLLQQVIAEISEASKTAEAILKSVSLFFLLLFYHSYFCMYNL